MTRKLVVLIATVMFLSLAAAAHAATPMLSVADNSSGGHVCAVTQSGKLYCWGGNTRGQLGVTTGINDSNGVPTPQLVPLPAPAVQVATGGIHTCALLETGAAYCWGSNFFGELGNNTNNGTLNANPTPSLVPTGVGVTSIAAGGYDTCFVYSDGIAKCIGDNGFGQLAFTHNAGANPAPIPMQMSGALVAKVVIGGNYSCVLLRTASVRCEGFNPSGELANNTALGSYSQTPVAAGLSGPVSDIDAGTSHACAILQDSTTWCWGTNSIGQLGIGSADGNDHYAPLKVAIGPAKQLALGATHTCARLGSIGTDCWGNNLAGQLGVSDNILTLDPNPTPLLSAFDGNSPYLAAGGGTTCQIRTDGIVSCAGDNSESNLGVSRTTMDHSYIPVQVNGLNVLDATTPKVKTFSSNPKIRYKKSGGKILATISFLLGSNGTPLTASTCAGAPSVKFERKSHGNYRKIVGKTVKLTFKSGCRVTAKLKLAKKYSGKKLYVREKLPDTASLIGFDTRWKKTVKHISF